ncbi:RNA methyltransferase [Flavobacterium sp. CYK-4]|uniref:RNA methyltransferase n=1 Tax=Flavobacterium lotistagni TaxID=2709660 RepID=UPI00140A43E0|nr:RNA methyltransferase [Flavobacterium lotistagni]NHM05809.1 RNA methyltransferase [Flavobacterium lotistagni]
MVSKNQIKVIASLQQKKYRALHQMFVAEGQKVIQELIDADFELVQLLVTEAIFESVVSDKKTLLTAAELQKISALNAANNCLAVFKIPEPKPIIEKGLMLALDDVRDPGNLGTILRICDWYGITQLICSEQTVDLYNPKVVQATMGSIARMHVHYLDLEDFLNQTQLPVYGTFMDGKNIYKATLPEEAIIVLGNEANGISQSIRKITKNKIAIPRFGSQTESLNVASAAAIVVSEFRRGFSGK